LKKKCKDAPADAVIRMKRTQYFLTYRVYKGGTANDKPRPFPGMGFFVFSSPLQLVPDTLSTTIVLLMVLSPRIGGIISELGGISPKFGGINSELGGISPKFGGINHKIRGIT